MTERIKLDKLTVDTEVAYGTYKKDTRYGVTIWGLLSRKEAEQLKQQILDDHEKIELLTKSELRDLPLLKVALPLLTVAGEQKLEIKQLKEEKEKITMENCILSDDLTRWQSFCTMNDVDDFDDLDKVFNELKKNLKQSMDHVRRLLPIAEVNQNIVDQIKKWKKELESDVIDDFAYKIIKKLKEILKSKEQH